MIEPLTEKQQKLIVKNVLASGFIAHYNVYGFRAHYQQHSLYRDIVNNTRQNQWDNFRLGEQNFDYYMSKKAVYNAILEGLKNERYKRKT